MRSPIRVVSSSIWPRMSSSSSARASGSRAGPPSAPSAWVSRSTLVRSEVSGVRSSWPASATRRRCRSRDASRAISIWLNAALSRATSSSPSIGIGRSSSVRAMSSTAVVRLRTGRNPLRATAQPAIPATSTPSPPKARVTKPSRDSSRSRSSSDCTITRAVPSPPTVGTATTRYFSPPKVAVRRLCEALPRATASSGAPSLSSDCGLSSRATPNMSARSSTIRTSAAPSASAGMSMSASLLQEVVPRGRAGTVDQLAVQAVLQLLAHRDVGADRHEQDGEPDRDGREQDDPAGQRAPVVPAAPVDLGLGLGLVGDGRVHDSLST